MAEDSLALPADIVAWMAEVTGGAVVSTTRVPGGATREAWFVDIDEGRAVRPLFLRYSRGATPPTSASHSLRVEAEVFLALQDTDVTVPRVLAVHPEHEAMLAERVPGGTWFYRIADPDEQVRTAQDFMRNLAALHQLDPRALALPTFRPVKPVREHVLDGLAIMRERATLADGSIDPLLRFSLDLLEREVPDYDGPTALVQGDTGPGNFMYEDGRVTAVVDWELAHLGDPMDDIAWLSLRTVQDTFTVFPDRLREYEALSGIEVDERRVWYYRLHAETLLTSVRAAAVPAVNAGSGAPVARDVGNGLIYGILHRRLTIEALAWLLGLQLETPELPATPDPSPWHGIYDDTLDNLQVIVPRIEDPLAAGWAKGVARVVKYMKELDRAGGAFALAELDDIGALLGEHPASVTAGRAALADAVTAGTVDDVDYVRYLWRQVHRDDHLLRTASGALRDRTWPPLR
jgi:aminoglycoside phosphotransferase (APT) family kinase protein